MEANDETRIDFTPFTDEMWQEFKESLEPQEIGPSWNGRSLTLDGEPMEVPDDVDEAALKQRMEGRRIVGVRLDRPCVYIRLDDGGQIEFYGISAQSEDDIICRIWR